MENQPFYAALAMLSDFYGITLQDDEFENMALHAWDHIGNKTYKLYTYKCTIQDDKVDLPCNVDIIEGVFAHTVDYAMKDNVDRWNFVNYQVEMYVQSALRSHNDFDHYGKLIDYTRVGNTLYFKNLNNMPIYVVYKGIHADDEGLPYLNFKEVDAIAKYCGFIYHQKKGMVTKDQGEIQIAQMLRQQWQFSVEDARVAPYLNQNDFNLILNVQSNWDRKRFGMSYKPIR